jgi:hypothetical protein
MATIGTAPASRRPDGDVACVAGSFDGDRLVAPANALRLLEAPPSRGPRWRATISAMRSSDRRSGDLDQRRSVGRDDVSSSGVVQFSRSSSSRPLPSATQDEIQVALAGLVGWVNGLLRADAALDFR